VKVQQSQRQTAFFVTGVEKMSQGWP
jgi:hypothetical protein